MLLYRLTTENHALRAQVEAGVDPSDLARRRLMVVGEGSFLSLLALSIMFIAWRRARHEAVQARQLEGLLVASTHELKTPVTALRAFLETVQSGMIPADRLPTFAGQALASCDRLEHTIEGILAYQAAVADQAVTLTPQALGGLVDEVLAHREGLGAKPEVDLGGLAEVAVLVTPNAFRVIVENLLDNARKYGGEHVAVRARAAGAGIELEVRDRGAGFPPGEADLLFDPYTRGSAGQKQHGTGLGLYIARALARSIGGELAARSDGPGTGATFTLTLRRAGG